MKPGPAQKSYLVFDCVGAQRDVFFVFRGGFIDMDFDIFASGAQQLCSEGGAGGVAEYE